MKREATTVTNTDILLKNQVIIQDIKRANDEFYADNNRNRKYFIETYGCQMNEHDSEKLAGMLLQMGYEISPFRDDADLIIFNTCCVRENAELKVFGNLGHMKSLKRKRPELILAVCGCMMQQPHIVDEIKAKYSHVDLVFGTHNVHNFPALLNSVLNKRENLLVEVWDTEGDIIEGINVERRYQTRAFVNIMFGCNNFCTYCIVPYTRGRERSRTVESIVNEVKSLVADGTKEVTLLGQNVNSYGKTLDTPVDFADFIREINKIEGLERIRFMTSHPKDISKKLIDVMAECDKVCDQLHLPIQSGSNAVLKAMNRKYTVESYLETIRYAKEKLPNLGISTDLIIGFPGETEQDIDDTIELIKAVDYVTAFTFIYSVRQGTPAAEFDNQIPEDVKHKRFERVLKVLNAGVWQKMQGYVGEVMEVLVDDVSSKDESILTGRSSQHITVSFPGDSSLIGQIVNVKITRPKPFSLCGELVK
ncbi:MAG: tRNA (N6-isopentenyl adenosine(37)-C2)-methylthiotransferase MiaB [Clostridia bacterium]|nr:tRNA (N6-isopentenyl adenosine(37)-C2)-methylthiotransferase MiaB [Clostridia bacterium]